MLFDYWHCGSMTDRNVAAPHAQTPVRLAGLSDEAAAAAAVLRMLVRLVASKKHSRKRRLWLLQCRVMLRSVREASFHQGLCGELIDARAD